MKQIFESDNICFVEVSELLVNDYLAMVNDEKNFTMFGKIIYGRTGTQMGKKEAGRKSICLFHARKARQ